MSEPNGAPTEQSQSLPERPKEEQEGEKGPSKSALKKAAKEKEKVRHSQLGCCQNSTELITNMNRRPRKQPNAKQQKTRKRKKPMRTMSQKTTMANYP